MFVTLICIPTQERGNEVLWRRNAFRLYNR